MNKRPMSTRPTYLVPFIPGNGPDVFPGGQVMLTVICIAEFPRGVDGTCAFCHGDPCAETSPESSYIWRYMNLPMYPESPYRPQTCPLCDGRPT